MKAKNLVQELNNLLYVTNDDVINNIIEKMKIEPVKHQTSYRDELSALINNYKMEEVEIGCFKFFGKYRVFEKYLVFAEIDMDLVGVDRANKEIVLLDHDDPNYSIFKISKDSQAFLSILQEYAKFSICKLKNQPYPADKKCLTNLAGGMEYIKAIDFLFN